MKHYRKNGLLDRRFQSSKTPQAKEHEFWQKYGKLICSIFLGLLAGVILGKSLWDAKHPKIISPKATGQTIDFKPVVVEARERFCDDVIKCIRDVGEELGRDNQTIMTMIRIAKYESNYNPKAKNPKSTASGVFQITAGTWYSNDCVGDKWNFQDNIRCAYEIQSHRGFQPWVVYNNGLAK